MLGRFRPLTIPSRDFGGYFDEKSFQPPSFVHFFQSPSSFAAALVSVAQNREKFVISAKAGGINAITGQAMFMPEANLTGNDSRLRTISTQATGFEPPPTAASKFF